MKSGTGTGKDMIGYDLLVDNALRGVMREALRTVVRRGLPGGHHFYLTFQTHFPGVEIPDYLRERYPEEMTIVFQYEFYGLEVTEDAVAVTLSFSGCHERLVIPFHSVTTFADPWVHFILQFKVADDLTAQHLAKRGRDKPLASVPSAPARFEPRGEARSGTKAESTPETRAESPPEGGPDGKSEPGDAPPRRGEVVTLDAFRKK